MHQFNHNYFKTIDTEEKAYILGFLYADGYNSDKQVVITQLEQDVDILEKINKALNADNQIKRKLQSTNNKTKCQLCYSSIDMCTDLTNLGCFRNKSLACTFPTFLDKSLIRHFIRGYFDGDGCITYRKSGSSPGINMLGTLEFLLKINEFFENSAIIGKKDKRHFNNTHTLRFRVQPGINFLYSIYNNSNIFLTRKYEKYKFLLNCKSGEKYLKSLE